MKDMPLKAEVLGSDKDGLQFRNDNDEKSD
jgi:hypothetical protein